MANPWSKFRFRRKLGVVLAGLIAALAVLVSLAVNHSIQKFAPSFQSLICEQFKISASVQKVSYIFPNHLVLTNVRLTDPRTQKVMSDLASVSLGFSFPIFSNNRIRLSSVRLTAPVIDAGAWSDYLDQSGGALLALIKSIPRGDMALRIQRGRFSGVGFETDFQLRDDHFKAAGFIAGRGYAYQFEGRIGRSQVEFTKVIAQGNGLFVNLWGSWSGNDLQCKGYAFDRQAGLKTPLYFLDIDGKAQMTGNGVAVPYFNFTLNGDHVQAQGAWSKHHPQWHSLITYIRTPHPEAGDPLQSVSLHFYGDKYFSGRARLHFNNGAAASSLRDFRFGFRGLRLRLLNGDLWRLKINAGTMNMVLGEQEHHWSLTNLLVSWRPGPARQILGLPARVYGGRWQQDILIDTSIQPWQISFTGRLDKVNAYDLKGALQYLGKCRGRLSVQFEGQTPKDARLTGTLSMPRSEFIGFDFLHWVAENFQMPALEHLSGADLRARFAIDPRAAALEDVQLDSDRLSLKGFFRVSSDDLVTSRLAARFTKPVLETSPIGRRILGLAPNAPDLPFEFRLSGNFHNMNFEWEESALKQKVSRSIPGFIKNIIDHRLNSRF